MDDDFNTAQALGHLYALTRILNAVIHKPAQGADSGFSRELAEAVCAVFKDVGSVLGLFQSTPEAILCRPQTGWHQHGRDQRSGYTGTD